MKTRSVALALIALTLLGVVALALGNDDGSRALTAAQAKRLFLQLPYRYEFRHVPLPEGASGAIAGKATTARGTYLEFGVGLGKDAEGVPVPKAGTNSAYSYPDGGFVFTDDLTLPGKNRHWHRPVRFHTGKQWNEAITIAVEMQEKLCRAATGKPCPP